MGSLGISFGRFHFVVFAMFIGVVLVFCIVLRVLNAIFICVSLNNFVSLLVSFPLNVKVAHSVFRR